MRILSGAVMLAFVIAVAGAVRPDAAAAPAGGAAQAGGTVSIAQHEATMKNIAQAWQGLQKSLKSKQLPDAAKNAKELQTLFGRVEQFWAQHKKDDAVKVAKSMQAGVSEIAAAASAGDQSKAMAALGNINGGCKQCHSTYREGSPQEGFNIKAGVISE